MDNATLVQNAGGLLGTAVKYLETTVGLDPIALVFALLTPVLLLYGRHEVRLRRLRSIKDFLASFGTRMESQPAGSRKDTDAANDTTPAPEGNPAKTPEAATKIGPDVRLTNNPSFEFVKSKYTSDLQVSDSKDGKKYDEMTDIEQIDWIIKSIGRFGSASDWKIFLSSIGFILLSYFGFSALHDTLSCGLGSQTCGCAQPAGAPACTATTAGYGNWGQLAIIGSLAFAGAYIAAIRNFVRSVAVFDLSPYTFLRHTAEIIASVIFTIVLFAVFRDPMSAITTLVAPIIPNAAGAITPQATAGDHIQPIWFGLAPLLGLLPQSATKFLLIKFQSLISWIKTSDDRFINVTKIVSPDIIDGIDYDTRFRLEECGIYDVQNLAAYNPIMLHIESPYGIYQVIDWIAQAQLCHILGPEKFLIFRELNIRTIFDLERAISSKHSVKAFDEICAGVLFASTSNLKEILRISTTTLVPMGAPVTTPPATPPTPADSAVAFCMWARTQIQGSDNAKSTEHVLRWIADDLHVRRLRRLWLDISDSLGPGSDRLPDTIDPDVATTPAAPTEPVTPVTPADPVNPADTPNAQ
jgi:hypothetical protein